MLLAYLIAYYILKNSVYGRHLYAIGGSLETALLFGIHADAIRISVYIISGALAGFAGIISSSRLGMGDPNSGLGYEMAAITIVVVGGASSGRRQWFNFWNIFRYDAVIDIKEFV